MDQESSISKQLERVRVLEQEGDRNGAKLLCLDILETSPDSVAALHKLAILEFKDGDSGAAISHMQQAMALEPGNSGMKLALCRLHHAAGNHADALTCVSEYLEWKPRDPEAHKLQGELYRLQGNLEHAITSYKQALWLHPDNAATLLELGGACHAAEKFQEAIRCYRYFLDRNPGSPLAADVHNSLGSILYEMDRFDLAETAYREVLQADPHHAMALRNLGNLLKRKEQPDEALVFFRKLRDLQPDDPLIDLQIASLCPTVPQGTDDIRSYREALSSTLRAYAAKDLHADFSMLANSGLYPPFGLMYHGEDERPIREEYAAVFRRYIPALEPHTRPQHHKIGMVVTSGHEGIFNRSLRGVLEHISPELFEIVIICSTEGAGILRGKIANDAIRIISFPADPGQIVPMMLEESFSLLYYWEVSTDSLNYFLPFMRLAPVQCTSWGIQVTTGIPSMDYYISSALVESEKADDYYSEKLVRASTLLTYQYRQPPTDQSRGRDHFGFNEKQNIYLFAHQIGKFHPDFDTVVAEILRGDPAGLLAITEDRWANASTRLRKRLRKTIPDVVDRVVFISRQEHSVYMSLLATADVLLDPLYYGGVNTSYDGFSIGKPIITMPTDYHIGRYVYGCYKKMGIDDCIAANPDEYVRLALKTGMDRNYRKVLSARILTASDALFEDMEAVWEHERIFMELIEKHVPGR